MLFTADPRFWGIDSRRILRTLPGPAGHYQFAGVLPGESYLAALPEVDASEFSDPSFFEQLVPASIKIILSESEAKTQELRLAGGAPMPF